MIRIGKYPKDMKVEEVKRYFDHANTEYPNASGVVDIYLGGDNDEFVDLRYMITERDGVPSAAKVHSRPIHRRYSSPKSRAFLISSASFDLSASMTIALSKSSESSRPNSPLYKNQVCTELLSVTLRPPISYSFLMPIFLIFLQNSELFV